MYAMSFRWWDTWKEHVMNHPSVFERDTYLNKVRTSIESDSSMPDSLKSHVLNSCKEDNTNGLSIADHENNTQEDNMNSIFSQKKWKDLN